MRQAVLLLPDLKDPHWNLAMTYLIAGQTELGLDEVEKSVELGYQYYKDKEVILYLAKAYLSVGDYQQVITHYYRAIALDPDDSQLYTELASIYALTDNQAKVKQMTDIAQKKAGN